MNGLSDLMANQAVYALGWTLLHSLWQVGLIAVVVGSLHLVGRNWSANARYLIALGGLTGAVVVSLGTFIFYLNAINEVLGWADKHSLVAVHILRHSTEASWLFKIKIYLNQHLTQIVAFWGLGFLVYFARYCGSLIYCQRLRYSATESVPEAWSRRIARLSRELGVKKTVVCKLSHRVQSPCVLGHLKPIVLMPVTLLTQLDQDQVEAILLHELAHIRRHDYLVGLCQSLLKTAYFFNPFLLWISSRVDSERENACDDIAVASCKDRMLYARALEAFSTLSANGGLTMAATGTEQHIFTRIQRLFGDGAIKSKPLEGVLASCVIALSCAAVSFNAHAEREELDTQHYSGIRSLSGVETTQLLDEYTKQIVKEDGPLFLSTINVEQRLRAMSRDERAAFVGHLRDRVWQETYATWDRPERFQHLPDDKWLELQRLWLDDNYGHLFAYLEAPARLAEPASFATSDGTPGLQGKVDPTGERMEFVVPLELVKKLQSEERPLGNDRVQILFNARGDLVIQLDTLAGGEPISAAPTYIAEAHAPGDVRASAGEDRKLDVHLGKEFRIVELEAEFVETLLSGAEQSVGNGRLGAQLTKDGNIAIAVEPKRYSANRDQALKYLSSSVWQVSSDMKAEVDKKLAEVPAERKTLLQTPEEWERHRLSLELRWGAPLAEKQWATIKNRVLNSGLDAILNASEDDPHYQALLTNNVFYTMFDGIYVATRVPAPPKDGQVVFDIDHRDVALSDAVEDIRSYCPDNSFSPVLAQDSTPATVPKRCWN
jgi:beta-lactamase regulating signal transducer with metallopeptidase domain